MCFRVKATYAVGVEQAAADLEDGKAPPVIYIFLGSWLRGSL